MSKRVCIEKQIKHDNIEENKQHEGRWDKQTVKFLTAKKEHIFLQIWLEIRNIMQEANLLFEMELIW